MRWQKYCLYDLFVLYIQQHDLKSVHVLLLSKHWKRSLHDANFFVTGDTGGYHKDEIQCYKWRKGWHHDDSRDENLQCHQRRQIWHHNDSRFSVQLVSNYLHMYKNVLADSLWFWSVHYGPIHIMQSRSHTQRKSHGTLFHDDVIKWKHFPCYWTFMRTTGRSPSQRPVTRSSGVFVDLHLNKRLSKPCDRINRWPMDFPHIWPVTQEIFYLMTSLCFQKLTWNILCCHCSIPSGIRPSRFTAFQLPAFSKHTMANRWLYEWKIFHRNLNVSTISPGNARVIPRWLTQGGDSMLNGTKG